MNVKNNLPDDMEVILRRNIDGYSPLKSGNSDCIYFKYSPHSGDIYNMRMMLI